MKKLLACVLAVVCTLAILYGCTPFTTEDIANQDQLSAEASGLKFHKLGVATYDINDPQIRMFKNYLDGYIKECFPDVTFLYSDSLNGSEDLMNFLELCSGNGVEGVLVFGSYDLKKEVEFCAERKMYYIRPAAASAEADFQAVAQNPYFIGEIGPDAASERNAGVRMVQAMAQPGRSYLILSGGSALGNEMHRLRTLGILETLQKTYGFAGSAETLATVKEPTVIEQDEMTALIIPGYLGQKGAMEQITQAIASGKYNTLLSTIPVTDLTAQMEKADMVCGVVDCFSEENYSGFRSGRVAFVAGKYQSEIGPGFAALYNAVTGNAEKLRDGGKAFRLTQGFWTADSMEAYDRMYGLSVGSAVNAYNYEDLDAAIPGIREDADFASFRALVEAYSYEDCAARRG